MLAITFMLVSGSVINVNVLKILLRLSHFKHICIYDRQLTDINVIASVCALNLRIVFWATVYKTVRPMLSDRCLSCLSCLWHWCICGQTVGRIKMKLGMEVGLGPGHIVLDGDPASPPKKGQRPTIFGPCLLWPRSPLSAAAELLFIFVVCSGGVNCCWTRANQHDNSSETT